MRTEPKSRERLLFLHQMSDWTRSDVPDEYAIRNYRGASPLAATMQMIPTRTLTSEAPLHLLSIS